MTKPLSDYEKALRKATSAFLTYMLDNDKVTTPQLELFARDLTIVAHWTPGEEEGFECECPMCLAPSTFDH